MNGAGSRGEVEIAAIMWAVKGLASLLLSADVYLYLNMFTTSN